MELVYVHRNEKGEPDGKEYGGIDVGVGGERYTVIKEGSRQLVRGIPNNVAHLLEAHSWISTGIANADVVEQAAQEALRAQAKLDVAKKQVAQAEADANDAAAEVERQKAKRDESKKAAEPKKDADKK